MIPSGSISSNFEKKCKQRISDVYKVSRWPKAGQARSVSQKTVDNRIEAPASQPEAMQVVGECFGDKRKIENVSTSPADEGECTGDEKAESSAKVVVARQTLPSDSELARTESYVPPCSFENPTEMLSILRGIASGSDMRGKQHRANPD